MDNLNGRRPQPEGRSVKVAGDQSDSPSRSVVASRLSDTRGRGEGQTKQPRPEASQAERPVRSTSASSLGSNQPKKPATSPLKRFEAWATKSRTRAVIVAVVLMALVGAGVWGLSNLGNTDEDASSEVARQYQEQLPELKSKVNDNPDDAAARKSYAVALYATDNLSEARKQYEEAVKLNDKDATAYNNLGNVYRDLGDLDKATESYQRSIELNPKSINPYANLANIQLHRQDKADEAIKTYQAGLKELPDNTQLELLLGIAYEQKGDEAKAKSTYQNILSRDSDNGAAKASLERLEAE